MDEYKCGDCFHANLCEKSKMLVGFSRDNPAYCGMFLNSSDVEPVKHGRWEHDEWGSYLRRCSVCKKTPIYKDERGNSAAVYAGICINCGARMDGDWNV